MMFRTFAALAVVLIATTSASAEQYVAISNTAMSITGDIKLDDEHIAFSNGEHLDFGAVTSEVLMVDGEALDATIYQIAEPANPTLENGNTLCGSDSVTYIAAWKSADGLTQLAMFTGEATPESTDTMCASYLYEQAS